MPKANILDESKWSKAESIFEKEKGHAPKESNEFAVVTAIYKKLGGKFKHELKTENYMKEGFLSDVKDFVKKFVGNPLLVGIATYFIVKYLKRFKK